MNERVSQQVTTMELPEILRGDSGKRLVQGAAMGAGAAMFVGFYWGGWKLESTTNDMLRVGATQAKVEALAPICADRFQQASGSAGNMVDLKKISSWQQSDFIIKGGWASFSGAATPDSAVARACAELLMRS